MRLRQLEYLAAAWRHKSLTAAATELFVSVPTLSQQVRALEEELGVGLVSRNGRGVKATPEGDALVPDVEQVLRAVEDLQRHADDLAGRLDSTLSVGVTHSAAITLLPQVLASVQQHHPKVIVRIQEGSSSDILRRIVDCELDTGLVAVSPLQPVASEHLSVHEVLRGEIMVCCDPAFGHAHSGSVTWADLADKPFFLFNRGTLVYDLLARTMPAQALSTRSVYYMDNSDSIRELVSSGLGVAFLPDYAAHSDVYNRVGRVTYVRLTSPQIPIGIAAVHNKQRYHRQLIQEFETLAQRAARDYAGANAAH